MLNWFNNCKKCEKLERDIIRLERKVEILEKFDHDIVQPLDREFFRFREGMDELFERIRALESDQEPPKKLSKKLKEKV